MALELTGGLAAQAQRAPLALAVAAGADSSVAWMDRVRQLPLPAQVAAVHQRMLRDTVYRGFQPSVCRGLVGTANAATVRVANQPDDTRPVGVTLFYVVDNYPVGNNTAAAVADFWRHAASRPVRQVALLQGPAAVVLYGTRAANGAVVLSSEKARRP